jgi:hypothetical protein
MNRE